MRHGRDGMTLGLHRATCACGILHSMRIGGWLVCAAGCSRPLGRHVGSISFHVSTSCKETTQSSGRDTPGSSGSKGSWRSSPYNMRVACSRMGELPVCQCGSAVTPEPHAADLQPDRPPWRADAAQYLPYTLLEAPAKSKTARGSRNRPRLESCGQLPLLLTSPN